MSTQCLFWVALAGSAVACSEPAYSGPQDAGDSTQPDAAPPITALPGATTDAGATPDQPGQAVLPSAASFDVLAGRAVSGTLELSNARFGNVATVCTASLCATGGLAP